METTMVRPSPTPVDVLPFSLVAGFTAEPAEGDQLSVYWLRPLEEMSAPARRPTSMGQGEFWITGERIFDPVKVEVRLAPEGTLLVQHESGVVGYGVTGAEAVEDIRSALLEHFDVLSSAHRLSPDLDDNLTYLRQHIVP